MATQVAPTPTVEQKQALGRYRRLLGPRAEFLRARIVQPVRLAARKFWLIETWPWRQRWGTLQCALNRHSWEEAPALDRAGEFVAGKPGRYLRCTRKGCRVLRGALRLYADARWIESDDFMVLVRKDCPNCYGRGFTGRMVVPGGGRCGVPCKCIRVQPAYIEPAPTQRGK